jgi:hypothetical protein
MRANRQDGSAAFGVIIDARRSGLELWPEKWLPTSEKIVRQ